MKIYIWNYQENMTTKYHSDGGAMAICNSLEEARDLLLECLKII